MSTIDEFFARYEEAANSFDPDLLSSLYTAEFMAGDPDGVSCGRNDQSLREAFARREAFFRQIGFRRATILGRETTPLDGKYAMAKVPWQMTFEKQPGHPLGFRFFITYFLFDPGIGPKAAFWISHEHERRVMREAGLID
ncbi:nuclear transport factor 2 family protein [Tahibacter caeni]|uniref:nuclear transport factor 2 family protein n=1 Tax=Tahibacter caeni TaxID=1453545 RepID=UPI002147BAAA|nr:nuclear transport factor 2 family protein [Tahibacter caeni]